MTLPQAIASCVRQAASFSGRATRSEFWFWQALCFILTLLCLVLGLPFGALRFVSIALLVPSTAVYCRRLHDINLRGWWQLVPLFLLNSGLIFFGNGLTAAPALSGEQAPVSPLIGVIAGLLLWLYWGTKRGSTGDNRFGADPLAPSFFVNNTDESLTALALVPEHAKHENEHGQEKATNLLTETLADGEAAQIAVFPHTLNREQWTLLGRGESGRIYRWKGVPVRTGRTYILSPGSFEDLPTPELSLQEDMA